MLDDLYPELDMAKVPRVAGVPRFAYRQGAQQLWCWLRALGSRDPVHALAQELCLIEYAGLYAQCWRHWLQGRRHSPASLPPVGASTLGTTARLLTLGAMLGAATAMPVAAPSLHLSIQDGRVWLTADGASLGDILAEWARVGQTQIVNRERVQGGPLTLQLTGMPESAALDLLLRSAGGYVAVERNASRWTAAMSRYGRIIIVPASAGPADPLRFAATPTPAPPTPMLAAPTPSAPVPEAVETAPGVRRLIGPDGLAVPDDQNDAPPPRQTVTGAAPRGRGGFWPLE
jgi:hypothetical protein